MTGVRSLVDTRHMRFWIAVEVVMMALKVLLTDCRTKSVTSSVSSKIIPRSSGMAETLPAARGSP